MVAQVCNHSYWEAEIVRIAIWGQLGQKVCKIPFQPMTGCDGSHLILYLLKEAQIGGSRISPGGPKRNVKPYLKNNHINRVDKVAQEVECLPSKHKDPSSTPNTIKKK
jgi:hypothetical protein